MMIQNNQSEQSQMIARIISDKNLRLALTRKSHYWFFHTYFADYVKYSTAEFQKELFEITEDDSIETAVIVAFRGSAKSTIMTMSYPIWAILGIQQRKFILIISQTQSQARLHLANIKRELENNALLRKEMGPFEEKTGEWGSTSLVLPKFNARITVVSAEQSIRGIRHGANRPDLIICDDVEDLNSVKTAEGRNKTHSWFSSEVLPIGDRGTKTIIVGNLLHEDSLLMRLKANIEKGTMDGIYRSYPLVDSEDNILWPGKFKNMEEVDAEYRKIGNESAWQREFMLKIIPDDGQVIHPGWIQCYDQLPAGRPSYIVVGVDLAISQKTTADCTAMVSAYVYGHGDNLKVYILPHPINQRITFPETLDKIRMIDATHSHYTRYICVEDVAYQDAVIQQLKAEGIRVEGIRVHGQDKKSRLTSTTDYVFTGRVLFPSVGAEDLIQQLVGFGVEKHDDLADAFAFVILKVIDKNKFGGRVGVFITKA